VTGPVDRVPVDRVPVDPPLVAVRRAVAGALAEDVLPLGDLTASLVAETATARVKVVARQPGVVAGRLCALEAFSQIDPTLSVHWLLDDGRPVAAGSVVAEVSGSLRSILTAERTALNFLGHLSGVATTAAQYVKVVTAANPATRVLDTRKTTPGLRSLEKAAVRAGGAFNHRGNLSEAILVKDNHLGGLTIGQAVARAREWWPGRMVEVECDRAEQVTEAVAAGAGSVLLDNMTPAEVASCVTLVRQAGPAGRVLIEVSGRVTLDSAPRYAAAGADLISVGAITHSAPVLDLGLDLEEG
jgi:nicotinate-nucleotide pyrophosphorylase (carboxylating)